MLITLSVFLLVGLFVLLPTRQTYLIYPHISLNAKKPSTVRGRRKPQWVVRAVIRLKAQAPHLSHRKLANAFNAAYKTASIGKSFVGYTLKNYAYEVLSLRKKFKNKPPHLVRFNLIWGIDLTFVNKKPMLGIVEHHSRKLLCLIPLKQKSSVQILKALLCVLETHSAPKIIRTDNERCFNSALFKFSLAFLGIKHQLSRPAHPWDNGRIERLFGTFKSSLAELSPHEADLFILCQSFSFWYNHVRLHQNLNAQTPESVHQQGIFTVKKGKPPDG